MTHEPDRQDPTGKLTSRQGVAGEPDQAHTQDFASTLSEEHVDLDAQWWSESTDGRCSEDAALFAASQPAPLSVV